MSTRQEIGLLAISLGENSLGRVVSVNGHAQSVFGWEERELLGQSVNNIMPSTFAQYHDSLLQAFLRNRYKKVNGDERVLVGRSRGQHIFPIMLRLQRTLVTPD